MTHADIMKEWRRRLGFTQARAAEVLGVSLTWIKRIERGDRPDHPDPVRLSLRDRLAMAAVSAGLKPFAPRKKDVTER